jgi:aryl-alcohol dehydrogenase-like predicted oxidoreductase
MQYTHLGRSGLSISRLCLGTMNFGPQTQEAAAHSIMDSAQEAGINFFDTANVYGGTEHRGWTEEILGRWFAKGGQRRVDEVKHLLVSGVGTVLDAVELQGFRGAATTLVQSCDEALGVLDLAELQFVHGSGPLVVLHIPSRSATNQHGTGKKRPPVHADLRPSIRTPWGRGRGPRCGLRRF